MANLNVFQVLPKLSLQVPWEASEACLEMEDRVSKSLRAFQLAVGMERRICLVVCCAATFNYSAFPRNTFEIC